MGEIVYILKSGCARVTTTSRLSFRGWAVDLEATVVVVFSLRLTTTTSKLSRSWGRCFRGRAFVVFPAERRTTTVALGEASRHLV